MGPPAKAGAKIMLASGRYAAAVYNLFWILREGTAWGCEQMVRGMDGARRMKELRHSRLI